MKILKNRFSGSGVCRTHVFVVVLVVVVFLFVCSCFPRPCLAISRVSCILLPLRNRRLKQGCNSSVSHYTIVLCES